MTFQRGGRKSTLRLRRAAAVAVSAVVVLLGATSCRLSPTSPARDPATGAPGLALSRGDRPGPPVARLAGRVDEPVPTVAELSAEVRHGTLYLVGRLVMEHDHAGVDYAPDRPGGWCLQVFVDTDQASTGYWRGYEYVVRGTEWEPAGHTTVVRRITLEPGYPGGWGPACGAAALEVGRDRFAIAVPLGALGGDDGNLDFALETYATVACADCPTGISHHYAADYFGRCAADGRSARGGGPVVLDGRPGTGSPRPHTGSAAPAR